MRTLLLTAILSTAVVLAFAAGPQLEIRYVNPAKVANVASNIHVVRGVNYPLVPSRERALGYYQTMYSKTNQSKVIIYVLSEEKKKTELLDMP